MRRTRFARWRAPLLALLWLPCVTRGDMVLDWNALMLDCIRLDNTAPTISTRNLALLNTAIFDAVNSITRTHQPYRFELDPPPDVSIEAAAVGAGYETVVLLYPSRQPRASALYNAYLASAAPGPLLTSSLEFGRMVGMLTVDSRGDDGSKTEVPYVPSSAPGEWQRTPPYYRPPLTPQWGYVDLFCLPDVERFLPAAPPSLDSVEYAAALNEVKAIGRQDSALRTDEEGQIAVFWSDFSYTAMPPGHWFEIAATLSQSRGLGLEENARMFALLSLAQADAAIVCWEAKYRYNLWRPITAIWRAEEGGNEATQSDSSWESYIESPPFPSYPSGHSTFSMASAQVLTLVFKTDAIEFTTTSDASPGRIRQFNSLSACAEEVGMSRIYGGIHFQFDNSSGKTSGKQIGEYVSTNFLLPNDRLPRVQIEEIFDGIPVISLHGRIGTRIRLMTSSDLANWTVISTNEAMVGGVTIEDYDGRASNIRFYRLEELR
jgi:PAP2 superfamily